MPESLPRGVATLTRRTTFAALPLVALGGCRWGPEDEESPEVEQAQDADAGLVGAAVAAITGVSVTVSATAEAHRGLGLALAPFTAMHTAHLAALSPSTVTATPTSVDSSSRAALAEVRRQELRLQTQLADLATSAISGTLARALASMSASVAQHVAVLPEIANEGRP